MKYDFDTVINRRGTNSAKWDLGDLFVKSGFAERFDEDTISAFTADMDFRCAQPIIDAIKEVADHGIFGYTSLASSKDYYKAIIQWFGTRYGWKLEKDWIVYMNGTVNAMRAAVRAYSKKGEGIIIMRPVYFPFTSVVESLDRKLINCQLLCDDAENYSIDFDAFEKLASDMNTKVFILCNPHNPAGRVWRVDELRRIAEICKRHDVLILADEIHGDLTRAGVIFHPIATVVENTTRLVTFTTANKSFNLAGLEITNVIISDEDLRNQFKKEIGHVSISPFGIAALVAAYTEGGEWLDQVNAYIDENIDWVINFLTERMPKVKCARPEGTYILWMNFRGYEYSAEEIRKRIHKDANVFLESGTLFDPDNGEGYERICLPMSRSVVKEAFYRIEKAFCD